MSRLIAVSFAGLASISLALAACQTSGDTEERAESAKGVVLTTEAMASLSTTIADGQLRPLSAFTAISDGDQRAAAIFTEMGKVLTHPRCVNCHPRTDRPLQGDQQIKHNPPVTRGPDGHGVAGLQCATCHGPDHVPFTNGAGSVPGNPKWALAPIEMAWEGKTIGEICQQLRDPARSHMTLEELHKHNAEDVLVAYGWDPGPGRQAAPGTQSDFGALTRAWIDAGAACPA